MTRSKLIRFALVRLGLGLFIISACTDLPTASLDFEGDEDSIWQNSANDDALRILTWNAYLGGDTGPLFSMDFNDVPAVLQAVNTFWAQVQSSDIDARMGAIADEIAAKKPHIVSLLEIVQFGVVDMTTGQVVGGADLLTSLQAQLAQRGLAYELVAAQANTSSALPLEVDMNTFQVTKVLSFTDRVAMLRRSDIAPTSVVQGKYQTAYDLGPLKLERGYVRTSFRFDEADYHVVATHLETQGLAPIQAGQLQELMDGVLAGLEGVTILTGDLNSDAEGQPGDPSYTESYETLLAAGFKDAWLESSARDTHDGVTCCQSPALRNGASLLDERIDFVLYRLTRNGEVVADVPGAVYMELVGEEQGDRVGADGLWPADHAGLAGMLRLVENAGG